MPRIFSVKNPLCGFGLLKQNWMLGFKSRLESPLEKAVPLLRER
jgi:hypothetical protein